VDWISAHIIQRLSEYIYIYIFFFWGGGSRFPSVPPS
jgi:hypothetical protein